MVGILEKINKGIIGRGKEILTIISAIHAGKHVLLEGPPGTSKSTLLRNIANEVNSPLYIIQGNIDLTPAKLVGHFNPAKVIADNYDPAYFEKGPLTRAMEEGGILYLEEFNRMPADVANVLITPMEERKIYIPRYGTIQAARHFTVIAAQNPYDDVGTVRVSRAFMDRICLIKLGYQNEAEEQEIVYLRTGYQQAEIIKAAVKLVRATREHPEIKLGASVRAAIDIVDIFSSIQKLVSQELEQEHFLMAARMALSNKIWLNEMANRTAEEIIEDLWDSLRVEFKAISTNHKPTQIAGTSEVTQGISESEKENTDVKKKLSSVL